MKRYFQTLVTVVYLFSLFSAVAAASVLQVKVTGERVNIYKEADNRSRILTQVSKDTYLLVKEKTDRWYRVQTPQDGEHQDIIGYVFHQDVREVGGKENRVKSAEQAVKNGNTAEKTKNNVKTKQKKDKLFLMGLGMLRINWARVRGNEIRFRYSDLGLPTELSTRERASFMVDGTFGNGKYTINGHVNYDPENRITEPPLEFLLNVGSDKLYLSAGDYRMGVMMDSVFSRYYHPFRGGILGYRGKRMGIEVLGGLARGESGIDEFNADAGSGPYYLADSPILRGSEMVYLVTRSATNPDMELKRTPMVRNKDYFIDYDRGSIIFSYSLYPYDELGNPVSLMVSYQFESLVGRFSRAVFGFRAYAVPVKPLRLSFSYIADADKNQSLGDILKDPRGIYSFGVNVDTRQLTLFGEASFSSEPTLEKQQGFFGGGLWTLSKRLRFFFNGWSIDTDFPTFANKQLQYGYSLFQIFPSYAERTIFLSPFQFTRNLGAELYPFSLARLSIDENEAHGFWEWENKKLKISTGYGVRKETSTDLKTDTLYASGFYNGDGTMAWGKIGLDRTADPDKTAMDSRTVDVLAGIRHRVKKFSHGDIYVQADYKRDWYDDFLDLYSDTYRQTYSLMAEYLTGSEGVFAGYRKETMTEKENDQKVLDADIFELGIRRHIYKGFFLDSRYRREESTREGVDTTNDIVALGAGVETKKFRAMARYEVQTNRSGGNGSDNKGKRKLWSLFLFGSPLKRMSISLRYYNQNGRDEAPLTLSLTERSEEQLGIRFLWRPWQYLNLYSQWRYDTNIELYPPLDRTKSNSLASVQGLKLTMSKRFEFLANYKLIKVWGPIDNRKYSVAAELGYLLFRHIRIGIGGEYINFSDAANHEADYRSTIGYFKLVVLY
jgi:hypothetical protein